jgi:hypothetical protein
MKICPFEIAGDATARSPRSFLDKTVGVRLDCITIVSPVSLTK